ncbi:MAG: YdcF family protein [Eubacterium sp.]|nr:YdcF family protein [Eubacterium sp.]
MSSIITDIGNFIFVEDEPQNSDIIFIVGGSHPELGEKAAELYNAGFAPYVVTSGKYGFNLDGFPGPRSKKDTYDGKYETESDFFCDVLTKNGVPRSAIIEDNKSEYTRQNADFARAVTDEAGVGVKRGIIVCKRFHARRCLMFYQSAFPKAQLLVVPADISGEFDIAKDNWHNSEYGIKRVLGELKRCGEQINAEDITKYQEGV